MVVIGWRAMYVAHVPDRHFRTPPLPCSPVGPTCRCCCRCSTAMPSDSSSKAWDQLSWRYDQLRSGDDHGIVMPLFRILRHLPPLRMRPLTPRHKEQNHRGYLVWRLLPRIARGRGTHEPRTHAGPPSKSTTPCKRQAISRWATTASPAWRRTSRGRPRSPATSPTHRRCRAATRRFAARAAGGGSACR